MKKYFILIFFVLVTNLSATNQKPSYFERIGKNAFSDLTHTFLDAPGVYKNMFVVPFTKTNLKKTGISIGILGTSFFFDRSFNDFSRDEWEPICNKPVRHIKLPLPILRFGNKVAPIFNAPNSFHYDFVFLTFAQYGYLFSLFTENDQFRHLTLDLMQATLYSFVFAQPAKAVIGRARPARDRNNYGNHTPWEWGNSSWHLHNGGEYNSFPSFHSTFYSSYCTIIMDYLGYRWAGPLLACFFFFQQPAHDHWLSDIVAGQIFGYWLASSILDTPEEKENNSKSKTSLLISPYHGGVAVNLTYEF